MGFLDSIRQFLFGSITSSSSSAEHSEEQLGPRCFARRDLRDEERRLIERLAKGAPLESLVLAQLEKAFVADMNDGGMGSLRFNENDERTGPVRIKTVGEAEFLDSDGVPVQLFLDLDEDDKLYELDMWKVDYSPLQRYPHPDDLRFDRMAEARRDFEARLARGD